MIPPIPLGHPDDFVSIRKIIAVFVVGIAKKRVLFLTDDGSCRPVRIDFDNPVDLVPALVVLEHKGAAVLPPLDSRHIIGIGKERIVHHDLSFCFDNKEHGDIDVQGITRLGILHLMMFRLKLVVGGRFDIVNHPMITAFEAVGRQLF